MIMRRKASSCELKLVSIFAFGAENHARFVERFNVYGQEFYGMTEIGGGTYVPAHRLGEMTGSGSCGVPAPYREVIFADDDGNPVPPGQAGELCVRGCGLLQGYYKNPEATADAFCGDWFRTGDLARVDGRGFYYIIGRNSPASNIANRSRWLRCRFSGVLQEYPRGLGLVCVCGGAMAE